jgi:hypothetical protein
MRVKYAAAPAGCSSDLQKKKSSTQIVKHDCIRYVHLLVCVQLYSVYSVYGVYSVYTVYSVYSVYTHCTHSVHTCQMSTTSGRVQLYQMVHETYI